MEPDLLPVSCAVSPVRSAKRVTTRIARIQGQPAGDREVIRRALQQLMPGDAYVTITPFAEVIGEQTRSWKLGAAMFIAFGMLALLLAAVGLYAVVSYTVTRRTHEVGVRIALGAHTGNVLWLGMRHGLMVVSLGTAIGAGGALAIARPVAPLLFGESPRDPWVYGVVILVMLAVAAAASIIPAARVARLDPNISLRNE